VPRKNTALKLTLPLELSFAFPLRLEGCFVLGAGSVPLPIGSLPVSKVSAFIILVCFGEGFGHGLCDLTAAATHNGW
jgi:hypothetical protein